MTPRQIVASSTSTSSARPQAKRAVAIALRNRVRRQKLPPEMAEDVMPKNIIMIGSTGVGKTEIARRLARMSNSPFLKVEASKFTEVGYVGRDVESMIRDLSRSRSTWRARSDREVADKAGAERRGTDSRSAAPAARASRAYIRFRAETTSHASRARRTVSTDAREAAHQLRDGKLDDRLVEIEVRGSNFPTFEIAGTRRASRRWTST